MDGLLGRMRALFDVPDLSPHGFCLAWDPLLIRLYVVSDGLIALSYYAIPLALGTLLVKRRDLTLGWMVWLFVLFILACGTTHVMEIVTLWHPAYVLQGAVKVVTAVASILTAALLWPLLPRILALPSPLMLRQANERLADEVREKAALLEVLQAETAERQRTEAMLSQAQRMESIGQLTGGVAHDFNNLLMVIQGNLEVLQMRLGKDEGLAEDKGLGRYIDRSLRSVRQGSALTQQLLAFARRQPLQPAAVDVNQRIRDLMRIVPQSDRTDIDVRLQLAEPLWLAEADPQQLDSAVLNLVINARDAMPQGGRLEITTANTVVRRWDLAAGHDIEPGDYITIAVSDTGTGMPETVRAQAFEPFFTTKPVGSGSGLGLSQVYGFAKQSRGHAALDSEPGRGTTVTLQLRRWVHAPADAPRSRMPAGD